MKRESEFSTVRMLALLLLLCAPVLSCRGGSHVVADCAWNGESVAWLDKNRNGVRDEGEPPLAGVRFLIDDTLNRHTNVGQEAVSNRAGVAALSVWLPGCPKVEFEIYAEPPDGYVATTQTRVSASGVRNFTFGFVKGK